VSAPAPRPNKRKTKSPQPAAFATPAPLAPIAEEDVSSETQVLETEAIAQLAHLYWEARGCQGGSADEDWLRAEQKLRNDYRRQGGNHGPSKTS
jgi:hypothetical protein